MEKPFDCVVRKCPCGCGHQVTSGGGSSPYVPGHEPELDHTEYDAEVEVEIKG
jgi:hypothetical protein